MLSSGGEGVKSIAIFLANNNSNKNIKRLVYDEVKSSDISWTYRLSELIRQKVVETLGDMRLVVTQSTAASTADCSV